MPMKKETPSSLKNFTFLFGWLNNIMNIKPFINKNEDYRHNPTYSRYLLR